MADPEHAGRPDHGYHKSRQHILDHRVFTPGCPGCEAKARNAKHYKGTFERSEEHKNIVTMDQVSMVDKKGTFGIGEYRYAMVLVHPDSNMWDFVPLQSLRAGESEIACLSFCNRVKLGVKVVLVYCDAHRSLITICENRLVPVRHPPPGHPGTNKVVERKVGVALAGIRHFLATAGGEGGKLFLALGWARVCVK